MFIPLVAGCASVKVTIKAPSFAKQGKEITQAEYKTNIIAAIKDNEFFKEDKDLSSKVIRQANCGKSVQKRVRDKKTYYSKEIMTSLNNYLQYDTNNLVAKLEQNAKSTAVVDSDDEESNQSEVTTLSLYAQQGIGDYQNKILEISDKELSFEVINEIGEGENAKTYLDAYAASYYVSVFNSAQLMHFAEATDTRPCHFYQNKNTFTVTYKEVHEEIFKEVVDGKEIDATQYQISREIKAQADLTNGSETVKFSEKQTLVYLTLADYPGAKKGDVLEMEIVNYVDLSAVDKDVKVNKINSLENYLEEN